MAEPESVTVEIANWDEYQPRADVKRPSWFRLEHTLIDSHKFFDFTHEEFKAWIYFLSLASRESSPTPIIMYGHAERVIGVSRDAVNSAIQKLQRNGALTESVTYSTRESNIAVANASTTDGRTRRTRRTNERDEGASALLEIWNQGRGHLPEARGMSATRRKHAEARWAENPDAGYWTGIVQRLARSSFCQGKNDRGWKADFDFLLQPETQHKALEGKYDNRGPSINTVPHDIQAEMAELEKMRKDCVEGRL